jgi:hypothetical protein
MREVAQHMLDKGGEYNKIKNGIFVYFQILFLENNL